MSSRTRTKRGEDESYTRVLEGAMATPLPGDAAKIYRSKHPIRRRRKPKPKQPRKRQPVYARTITLHPGQAKAWESDSRFVGLIAGTGGGKSFFGAPWLYREIAAAEPGSFFMIAAPTYKLLYRAAVANLVACFAGSDAEGELLETKGTYVCGNGSVIYLCSADNPKSLEAIHVKAAWLDEAGQMSLSAWIAVQGRLGLDRGRALLTTTPYGRNWLYTEFDQFARKGDPDYFVTRFPSTLNPHYPQEEYERAQRTLPTATFAMRYRGEFAELEGLVYPELSDCLIEEDQLPAEAEEDEGNSVVAYVGGVDWGYYPNPFAAMNGYLTQSDVLVITSMGYRLRTLLAGCTGILARGAMYWADPSDPLNIAEIKHLGYDIEGADAARQRGIEAVLERIREGKLLILRRVARHIMDEAATYQFNEKGEASKTNDHLLDALRYLCMGVRMKYRLGARRRKGRVLTGAAA